MTKKIVIALGGNALGDNPEEQKKLVKIPAKKIAQLVQLGHQVLVGHGNGPQVGMIFNAFGDAHQKNPKSPLVQFPESGAMSQGYIGLHLTTAINNELNQLKIKKDVLYLLTQTIVDKNSSAFKNPTKPVGPFYETIEKAQLANPNSTIVEDSGRGYRKVVPSPAPIDFLGIDAIKRNFNENALLIVGGGGGIPTIEENGILSAVDGVIDKDFALAKIADKVDADTLIILTGVEYVYVNFNQPDQKKLENVTVDQLETYIKQNQFAPGSMLPKVQAAIDFVKENPKRTAIIAELNKVELAIQGQSGTKIVLSN